MGRVMWSVILLAKFSCALPSQVHVERGAYLESGDLSLVDLL